MDSALIPKGVKRCPIGQFAVFIAVVGAVLLWGVVAMFLCYIKGLNQTNMNNAYGWYGDAEAQRKIRPSQRRRLTVDRKTFGFYHNLMGFPKVTVGEITGYALGGGFEMALMTDISVIARDTKGLIAK